MTPDTYTNREFFLEVGDGHELYVHDWGNKDAKRVIFNVHGGPGGGTSDRRKGQYDPVTQRVIFFDQRGAGRSLPTGSLEHNTTDDLVEDITKIADKLGIKQFILRGGSWGSTLSLAYALRYPERVSAVVIDGIFTSTQSEIDWLYRGAFQTFYPEAWQEVLANTPASYHNDPVGYHIERALEGNTETAKKSAYVLETMEGSLMFLDDRPHPQDYDTFDPTGAKLEIHYLKNNCFMSEGYILKNAHRLTMPVYIIQGRYDNVCPPVTAHRLHQALPNSRLTWTIAGHIAEHETWNVIRTILGELTR